LGLVFFSLTGLGFFSFGVRFGFGFFSFGARFGFFYLFSFVGFAAPPILKSGASNTDDSSDSMDDSEYSDSRDDREYECLDDRRDFRRVFCGSKCIEFVLL